MSHDLGALLQDFMDEPCRASWNIIGKLVDLELPDPESASGSDRQNGLTILRRSYAAHHDEFLSSDQLLAMASKDERYSPDTKRDVAESAGLYVFVSLVRDTIIKVGQSESLRRRIATQHLRHENQYDGSTVCGHYMRCGHEWPASINNDEITCILLPMPTDTRELRLSVERGLTNLLRPEIGS